MADWRPMLKRREDGFPRIMGVVNVTPDSFHARSRSFGINHAVEAAMKMASEGAEWIDIGGESTRPGASPVTIEDELSRVIPAIEAIRSQLPDVCISIDTRRSEVAIQALNSGADMVNDVSAMNDPGMLDVVSEHDCPVCIMHMQGNPQTMQESPRYGDVVSEVAFFLQRKVDEFRRSGISEDRILIDPGFGFGKTSQHNLSLLKEIPRLSRICPLLVGLSRKRIISELCKRKSTPADRLGGSLAMALWSAMQGASVVRVHDVKETKEMITVFKALGGDNIFSGVDNEKRT